MAHNIPGFSPFSVLLTPFCLSVCSSQPFRSTCKDVWGVNRLFSNWGKKLDNNKDGTTHVEVMCPRTFNRFGCFWPPPCVYDVSFESSETNGQGLKFLWSDHKPFYGLNGQRLSSFTAIVNTNTFGLHPRNSFSLKGFFAPFSSNENFIRIILKIIS